MEIKRGDVFFVTLGEGVGSEQGGERPCVVIQNDIGNKYSPTTIIACLTSSKTKANLPTHIQVSKMNATDIKAEFVNSTVLLEQVRTIDKKRLKAKFATLDKKTMEKIDKALRISVFNNKEV